MMYISKCIIFFLDSLPATLKTEFLELLTRQTKEGKAIPLNIDQRVQLIQLLLNETVKRFDFDVLDCPMDIDQYSNEDSINIFFHWKRVYDNLWPELAAKCPRLQHIREMRPRWYPHSDDEMCYLNNNVFNFDDMKCLETNCLITSGNLIYELAISPCNINNKFQNSLLINKILYFRRLHS